MIRNPEAMTSGQIRQMQREIAARVVDARRRVPLVREHEQAARELRRLLPLQREIGEWE